MTTKEKLIDLLKRDIEKLERMDIVEDSIDYKKEVEQIETTQADDTVRTFTVGKGRTVTFTWQEV